MLLWQQYPQELLLSGVLGGRKSQRKLHPYCSVGGSEVCELH